MLSGLEVCHLSSKTSWAVDQGTIHSFYFFLLHPGHFASVMLGNCNIRPIMICIFPPWVFGTQVGAMSMQRCTPL